MKAMVYRKYGSPEVLHIEEVEKPVPKDNEIRVKVLATPVTIGDTIMRGLKFPVPYWQGLLFRFYLGFRQPKRKILGMELAGIVESTGKDVTQYKKGDSIFGSTFGLNFGGYAEYKCFPEDGILAIKPQSVTYEQAAVIPGAGMTAISCLKKGNIQKGQKVLIYGASGAVGTYSVQLAKYFGAKVTGVCSTANLELIKSLGADEVIDYTREDFTENDEKYDVIFDAVGKLTFSKGKKSLKRNGRYLNVFTSSGNKENKEDLISITKLVEASQIKPVIDRTYPFAQIPEAHSYVEKGHKKGNVAITLEN
jgi:NADPH:quinone reductase-like Zn-dependent oxidoreductase